MKNITAGNKLFKSGKFMMTAAATIAVVASATATTLTSVNADDSAAPAKVTTSQKVEPRENHTYKGQEFDAPIRVETHDIWTANSESVIADNMSKQGIKSVDQLGDYKVVWGDTLSTIAAHFHVSTDELAQRFGIADVNYIAAGITMKDQANINALESQIVHDAQWNGEYNAKVAASQASDAAQSTGASDVTNAQADATVSTPNATPAAQAPVANTDTPAQAAKSSDTHIGGASDVINNIADGTKTNQTTVVTPAEKPATEAPKTDVPATNTDKGDDTNIGNASDVMNGVDNGKDTPAAQPASDAPAEAQKPASDAPKTDAPATNTDKGTDTNIGNASDVMNGVDNGKDTSSAQPASDAPTSAAPSNNTSAAPVETQTPASETPKTDVPATNTSTSAAPAGSESATPAAPTTPTETQTPASEAPGANDKPAVDAPATNTVPANPVDGSTFNAVDYATGRSFGPLTYHTSISGISVNDLTNGSYQGLWLDTNGNALDPDYPVRIFYPKAVIDRLVTRYNDAQTPTEGTELERPDQLVGGASGVMNSIG